MRGIESNLLFGANAATLNFRLIRQIVEVDLKMAREEHIFQEA